MRSQGFCHIELSSSWSNKSNGIEHKKRVMHKKLRKTEFN